MNIETTTKCTFVGHKIYFCEARNVLSSLLTFRIAFMGTHIFCIIDMDNKNKEPERTRYKRLRAKFAKPINKPKKGISCKVEFFETHLCTELFFFYYFQYTSRQYENQESLIKDLNKCVKYEKAEKFFSKGLHSYFERNGGSLKKAIANAEKSMKEKEKNGRDYTYSELGQLMKALGGFTK